MTNEIVQFESAFGSVTISAEDVRKYLARGNKELTEREIKLFLELCKYQKLNPFVGEAYAIKFGEEFQMVVGYDTYKRRAEENPSYMGRKSGIVVTRGNEVIQKEGTCLYPGETLLGGWCRVLREKNGRMDETYKEVGLSEYNKGQANWKTKPATMIEKVAVSQALRAAFPTDYAGLYVAEEVEPAAYQVDGDGAVDISGEVMPDKKDKPITQEQRLALFQQVHNIFGKEAGNAVVAKLIAEEGLTSTTGMLNSTYERIMQRIPQLQAEIGAADEFPPQEESAAQRGDA